MDIGEVEPRTRAALDLAGTHVFGTEPGRIPAALFEAYDASAAELDRAVLASALARCWVYAGQRNRAVPFAVAAVKHAEATGGAAVLADALDAALATHWGPDELEVRVELAAKLADVAAHLADLDARLQAHLWMLTIAAETLDVSELNRQVRALERLGEESRKALFFAATRRLMLDLMRGRADTVEPFVALARETADELADGEIVVMGMTAYAAAHAGDRDAGLASARDGVALAEGEGIREVVAEIAWIYLGLGLPDDARRLASTFDQRAVVNAGAIMFLGVTDDTLARACERLGDAERAAALREKALATYRRIGATWWRERLEAHAPATREPEPSTAMTLRPGPAGVWFVGRGVAGVCDSGAPRSRAPARAAHPPGDRGARAATGWGAETVEQARLGEVVDAQGLTAYRRRLAEIDTELDEADRWGDAARGTKLTAERDALLAEVSAVTGLGGRLRSTGSGAERARGHGPQGHRDRARRDPRRGPRRRPAPEHARTDGAGLLLRARPRRTRPMAALTMPAKRSRPARRRSMLWLASP